jgi:hypothetical protein
MGASERRYNVGIRQRTFPWEAAFRAAREKTNR